jgi:hypothetical protein
MSSEEWAKDEEKRIEKGEGKGLTEPKRVRMIGG